MMDYFSTIRLYAVDFCNTKVHSIIQNLYVSTGKKQKQTHSYLHGLEIKIDFVFEFLDYMQCHLSIMNFDWLSQCQLALDQPIK